MRRILRVSWILRVTIFSLNVLAKISATFSNSFRAFGPIRRVVTARDRILGLCRSGLSIPLRKKNLPCTIRVRLLKEGEGTFSVSVGSAPPGRGFSRHRGVYSSDVAFL